MTQKKFRNAASDKDSSFENSSTPANLVNSMDQYFSKRGKTQELDDTQRKILEDQKILKQIKPYKDAFDNLLGQYQSIKQKIQTLSKNRIEEQDIKNIANQIDQLQTKLKNSQKQMAAA